MENNDPTPLFPAAAIRLRTLLEDLHLTVLQLLPPALREADPQADRQAAALDREFFRLLRLASDISLTAQSSLLLPEADVDLAELTREICCRVDAAVRPLGLNLRFSCPQAHHLCALAPETTGQLLYRLLSIPMASAASGTVITADLRFSDGRALLSVASAGGVSLKSGLPLSPFRRDPRWDLQLCRRMAAWQRGTLITETRRGEICRLTLSLPDRQCGRAAVPASFDFTGGFNPTLIALADVLPTEAFLLRSQG